MANILFLPHRLPYPPNKGDKLRSYHMLRHLAQSHRVFLGSFIDDPHDRCYVDDVRPLCAGIHVEELSPFLAKLRSLTGLITGEALTLPYYRSAGMRRWVRQVLEQEEIGIVVVFSSAMAQYAPAGGGRRLLVDFVDVDSAKWTEYAKHRVWPFSWLFGREGRRLLAFERDVAKRACASFFVTEAEVALFRQLAPECPDTVEALEMGVDAEYFSPEHVFPSPFSSDEVPLVFTGAMDYWPNVDAVCWFAKEVLPSLRAKNPAIRFYVVGMRPAPAVQALAGEAVVVTGRVPDVRPYLAGARVVVVPLRVARGIQSKVLEAMAAACTVVVSEGCATAIDALPDVHFLTARDEASFRSRIEAILSDGAAAEAMGRAARSRVMTRYSWHANLSRMDRHLSGDTKSHG